MGQCCFGNLTSYTGIGVGVEPLGNILTTLGDIKRTVLLQNYPNPFNPETWIPYQLANDALVTLNIYDQSGQIVRILDMGRQSPASTETKRMQRIGTGGTRTVNASQAVPISINSAPVITARYGGCLIVK